MFIFCFKFYMQVFIKMISIRTVLEKILCNSCLKYAGKIVSFQNKVGWWTVEN